jgi:hypothetical protein
MSEIKVNKISPRTNCGTTTLGDSGDTFTIPAGVTITNNGTQTGFGRTGAVDWQTTPKTTTFTAVNGEGYFIDTSSGAVTMNLPSSPSAGAIVAAKDYDGSFETNACTVGRGGSNIRGSASDFILNKNNAGATFIYIDATEGWQVFADGSNDDILNPFIQATGGTITTTGNCKVHTFTGPGTFTVSAAAQCAANNLVSYMVIAGGGGGASNQGSWGGGGGGAGGYREVKSPSTTSYTASPLDGYSTPGNRITVSAQAYPIAVGGGGAGGAACGTGSCGAGTNGAVSTFSTISSAGGGGGGAGWPTNRPDSCAAGKPGGSGGGGTSSYYGGPSGTPAPGGSGNTPPVTPPQGNNGGSALVHPPSRVGGSGGGAGAVGADNSSGPGGNGVATEISGVSVTRAGGGGAGGIPPCSTAQPGGTGGGGAGSGDTNPGTAGTANTGGGGGGSGPSPSPTGGTGGSGIVIIRYKYQ